MSAPAVSIVYLTCRVINAFEWFADSLARQLDRAAARGPMPDIEVIVVDGQHTSSPGAAMIDVVGARFPCRVVAAKPTPFNGPHRLTRTEFFAAASARNTGLMYATRPYVVFVDDLSVLMDGWWDEVARAAHAGCVIAGAYQKRRDMVVRDGVLVRSRADQRGVDSRWALGRDDDWVPIAGGQLFGCSFGAPREQLLALNGCDELCDSIGGEDWHLGWRLQWSGAALFYSRRMLSIESEELHQQAGIFARHDPVLPAAAYDCRLRRFGVTERVTTGPCDSSHMIVDILFGTRCTQPLGNYYVLQDLDDAALIDLPRRFPRTRWFDDRPLELL